jgi:hypothetical protein
VWFARAENRIVTGKSFTCFKNILVTLKESSFNNRCQERQKKKTGRGGERSSASLEQYRYFNSKSPSTKPPAYQPISAVVIDIIHDGVITNKKRTTKNNPSTIFLSKGVF